MMSDEDKEYLSISSRQSVIKEKIKDHSRRITNGSGTKSVFLGSYWVSNHDRGKNALPLELCVFYCLTLDQLDKIVSFKEKRNINFSTCSHSQFLESMTLNFGNFSLKIRRGKKAKFRVNQGSEFNTSGIGQFYFPATGNIPDIVKNNEWQKFDLDLFLSRVNEISTR